MVFFEKIMISFNFCQHFIKALFRDILILIISIIFFIFIIFIIIIHFSLLIFIVFMLIFIFFCTTNFIFINPVSIFIMLFMKHLFQFFIFIVTSTTLKVDFKFIINACILKLILITLYIIFICSIVLNFLLGYRLTDQTNALIMRKIFTPLNSIFTSFPN